METPPGPADRAFAEFRRSGDPSALGEVVDLVAPELLRVALHMTRDAAEAEDVLQSAFIAAIERSASFDATRRVMPWLVGILAHEARRARARAGRTPDPERIEPRSPESPAAGAERAELLERLDAALARVPETFRPVLELKLRHSLTVTEIARALGRPPGTVRSQLARGTELLRRALPVGLASSLAALATPTRGLAAVRDAVIAHAAGAYAPAALATFVGGTLVMKKLALAAMLVVAAASAWLATRPPVRDAVREEREALLAPSADAPEDPAAPPARVARDAPAREDAARTAIESAPPPAEVEAPAPAASGTELFVHVRWADGSPAEGALAIARPARWPTDDAASAATNAAGVARFEGLPEGVATVELLRGERTRVELEAGKPARAELVIADGANVAGTVVDARNEPVAGADIWLSEHWRASVGFVVTRSDEHGRFLVRAVSTDHHLGARKRGYAPGGLRTVRAGAGETVEIVLRLDREGGVVRGRVTDARGEPIPRAQVLLGEETLRHDERLDDGSFGLTAPPQRAFADELGAFVIPCAPLGAVPLQARASGYAPHARTIEVVAGLESEIEITLDAEPRVRGRVLSRDEKPIARAWVHAGESGQFASASTWTRADGTFELAGLPVGRSIVFAEQSGEGRARVELVLGAGETHEWTAVLAREAAIEGQVVDARGEPMPEVAVSATPQSAPSSRSYAVAADASGRFSIPGVAHEAHVVTVMRPAGWREFPLAVVRDVWPGGAPCVLEVPDPSEDRGRIVAEIVGPDGAPSSAAEMHVWHASASTWRSFGTDGGRLVIEDVPEGEVELDLRHVAHPWLRLGRHTVRAGETLDLGRLELLESGRLRASLRGIDAELAAGLRTLISDASRRESGVLRIAELELTSGPLAPGTHLLQLQGDGVRTVRREVEIEADAETTIDLVLERCATREIHFTLPAETTKPPAWIALTVFDEAHAIIWSGNADCTLDPPRARISAPEGHYEVWVRGDGDLAGHGPFAMGAAGEPQPPHVLTLARDS